ncbi:MAG: hypothetical protein KAT05_15200 [Spirochaetes bacterium]|nr:hypothetical protein [Spirochaetota bacterium]
MKKILLICYILSLFSISIYTEEKKDPFYGDYELIKEFFSPRDEASQNEKRLIRYIEKFCNYYKLKYKKTKIDNEKDIVTNSYNIEIFLKGSSKQKEQLIIICPLNTPIINQQNYDNSISIQILLNLIKLCKKMPFKKDIVFLFSGANEGEKSKYYGIKFFLQNSENLSKSFVTILDILSNKTKILFSGSINKKPIPSIILNKYLNIDKKNLNIYFNRNEIYKARFYIQKEDDYASIFLKENINAVSFSNKKNTITNTFIYDKEYQNNLTNYFYNWLISLDNLNFPIDTDYHYQYIDVFGIHIILSETLQIIFFLFLIFFTIFTRFFFPQFQRLHPNLFIKTLPYFIIIFIIFFISTFIPLLLFLPIGFFTGIKKLYINSSMLYFLNILFIPLIIILMLFELLVKLPFPKRSYFYIYGAIIFSLFNLILSIIVDISIAYIYLWTIIALTLSQFTGKNFKLKYFFYSISPLPLIILIYNLTFLDKTEIIKNINPFLLNFFFAILTFPFILLILRVHIIYRNKYRIFITKKSFFLFICLIIILSIIILIMLSVAIFPEEKIVKARMISNITQNKSYLSLNSENNIGEIQIQNNSEKNKYIINKNYKNFSFNFIPPPYKLKLKKIKGDDLIYSMSLKSQKMIEYVKIYLISPKNYYPLESNYNFHKISDFHKNYDQRNEEVYLFLVGRNVGKNFLFKVYLLEGNYKLYIEIEYPFIDESTIVLKKPDALINYQSVFTEEIKLGDRE